MVSVKWRSYFHLNNFDYGVCQHIIEGLKVVHSEIIENEVIYEMHSCLPGHLASSNNDVIALVFTTVFIVVL